jgi:hypothetical protein
MVTIRESQSGLLDSAAIQRHIDAAIAQVEQDILRIDHKVCPDKMLLYAMSC